MATSPIPFIYASTSGNTETVMETVADVFKAHGLVPVLSRSEKTTIDVIKNSSAFVFGTSTWEHGALNPFFRALLKEIKTLDCSDKQAAFVGCGDRRYEPVYFCEGIEIVKRTWVGQGGTQLGETLKIQGESYGVLDTVIKPWGEKLVPLFGGQLESLPPNNTASRSGISEALHKVLGLK